jgi:hypothetical protein
LRTSRVNNKLSAYAILDGQFEFDKTPLAPVGTKALVFLDPKRRTSWSTHAVDAWYSGPAKQYYRNFKFYIPETRGYRIANTARFFPQHCKHPAIEPGDSIRLAAQDLISALRQNNKFAPISLHHKHMEALRTLSEIFSHVAEEVQPVPRVPTETTPSTSINPTNPATVRTTKIVHQRVTRRNTPMPESLPTIHEESKQSMERARRRERRANPVEPAPSRPKRTINQFQRDRVKVQEATPTLFPNPLPNLISQDDEYAGHVERIISSNFTPP